MLATTDMLVRQHMAYLKTLDNSAEELRKFETIYDHMYYYFHTILGMEEEESYAVVKDFYIDFALAPEESEV